MVVEVRTVDPTLYTVPPEANEGPRDFKDRIDPNDLRDTGAPQDNTAVADGVREAQQPRRRWDRNQKPAWTLQRPLEGVT